jgi:excisionase family DNA binding protein
MAIFAMAFFYISFHVRRKNMTEKLLDVDQLAVRLNVPKSWIYARTRETGPEAIPRIKLGKYCRFDEKQVTQWLERRTYPGA